MRKLPAMRKTLRELETKTADLARQIELLINRPENPDQSLDKAA